MTLNLEIGVLLATVAWTVLLILPPFVGRIMSPQGLKWGLSNRENPLPNMPPWYARAERAHQNMVENLTPFAIIVIVAQIGGVSDSWTQGSAVCFLIARVLHGVFYVYGITPWRTHVFNLSLLAEIIFVVQIIRHAKFA